MARPVLVSKGTVSVVTTNAPAPTYPASIAVNDIVFLQVVKYDLTGTCSISTPAGWTLLTTRRILSSAGAAVGIVGWYWQRAASALSGTVTVTTTGSTGTSTIAIGQIYRITGCVTTGNPFDSNWIVGFSSATDAVNWATIKEYHAAEELPVLLSAGAGIGFTQPPATPTGVTATTAADSSTTGADGYVLAYTATTPAEPTIGPFTSSTSRPAWATLEINFISSSYVGQTTKSGTDVNGTTTEAVPRVGLLADAETKGVTTITDFTEPFTAALTSGAWVSPMISPAAIGIDTTNSWGKGNATSGADGYAQAVEIKTLGKVRISAVIKAMPASSSGIGIGISHPDPSVSRQLFYNASNVVNGDSLSYLQNGSFQDSAVPISSTVWATGDTVIFEMDFINAILNIFRVRGGVETQMGDPAGAGWDFGSAIVNIINVATWYAYLNLSSDSFEVDDFTVTHLGFSSNAAESGSQTTGGGSTTKSGSDVNGSTTETGVPVGIHSNADANGVTTETGVPVGIHATSDVNSTTTDASTLAAKPTGTDVNGTTTENSAVTVPVSGTDANGATTDAISLAAKPTGTDTNSTTTEISTLTAPVSGSDVNGVTSEAGTIAVPVSASDVNGSTVENGSPTVPVSVSDVNGAETDATILVSAYTATDVNGATTDSGSLAVPPTPISGTDANGTTTEAVSEIAVASSSDSNSTTTEATSSTHYGADANAVTTEAATMASPISVSDTNSTTIESVVPSVALSASDTNTSTTENGFEIAALSGAESNGSTETPQIGVKETATDTNGTTTEIYSQSQTVIDAPSAAALTDTFTRVNEIPLAAPWAMIGTSKTFSIQSNQMLGHTATGDAYAYYPGAATNPDQFAEFTVVQAAANNDYGPAVRVSGGDATLNGYFFEANPLGGAGYLIGKHVNGVYSDVATATGGTNPVAGDVLRIEVTGNQIKGFVNGVLKITGTDNSLTTGQPGLFDYDLNAILDNWHGGNLVGGASSVETGSVNTLGNVFTGNDSNGTTTESVTEAVSISAADTNVSSDTSTIKAVITFADFNGSGENAILGAVLPVSDANAPVGDIGTLALNYILTDANAAVIDATLLVAKFTTSEINGESDSGSVTGNGVTNLNGTDTGVGSENSSLKVVYTISDSNSELEASILAAKPTGTDTAGATESTTSGRVGSEAGSGAETASESVLYVLSDTAIGVEAATEAVKLTLAEIGLTIDLSLISIQVISADTGTDAENTKSGYAVQDSGHGIDVGSVPSDFALVVLDVGFGNDDSQTIKWPYFPDQPPEILVASELEPAVLVAVGQPPAELVATQSEKTQVEIHVEQKPSIIHVGTDKPRIERIS